MSGKSCLLESVEKPLVAPGRTAIGYPRDFLGNRFVYVAVSSRARGLAIGINMNPDKFCNFECDYCEVNRELRPADLELDVNVMAAELEKTLTLVLSRQIRERQPFRLLSDDLLQLRHVALSGDGEPTLCVRFAEVVESVVHLRARRHYPFFKIVLLTNGTWLELSPVTNGLRYFIAHDEIWIKLDAGTQAYMDKVNRSEVPLQKVLHNIRMIGRKRPVIIQSLFPLIGGEEPPTAEIDEYIHRLNELKNEGARISLVQIYSANRRPANPECGHLPLKSLSLIRHRVRAETGLNAEVF